MDADVFKSLQTALLRVGFFMTKTELGRGTFGVVYKGFCLRRSQGDSSDYCGVSTDADGSHTHPHSSGKSATQSNGVKEGSNGGAEGEFKSFRFGRAVAIKLVHGMLRERDLPRALHEIMLQDEASKGSIAVLPILYAGDIPVAGFEGKCNVIVTDFVDVTPFTAFLKEAQIDDIRAYMFWLLSALSRCNECGIVHRDVKPRNFLYDARQRRGCLTDFGLAELESSIFTKARKQDDRGHSSVAARSASLPPHPDGGVPLSDKYRRRASSTGKSEKQSQLKTNAAHDAAKPRMVDKLKTLGSAQVEGYISRLLSLLHCRKCAVHSSDSLCSETQCAEGKRFWMHFPTCKGSQSCTYPKCSAYGNLLRHHSVCRAPDCPVCVPARAAWRAARQQQTAASATTEPTALGCSESELLEIHRTLVLPTSRSHVAHFQHCKTLRVAPSQLRDGLPRLEVRKAGTPGYRAPEVLLGNPYQTTAIDVFAAGVILASLLSGRYPFFSDKQDGSHLLQMMQLFGHHMFAAAMRMGKPITKFPVRRGVEYTRDPVSSLLHTIPNSRMVEDGFEDAFDLMLRLLTPDPRDRMTADAALTMHPFFNKSLPRVRISVLNPLLRPTSAGMIARPPNALHVQPVWEVKCVSGYARRMFADGYCATVFHNSETSDGDAYEVQLRRTLSSVVGMRPYGGVCVKFLSTTLCGGSLRGCEANVFTGDDVCGAQYPGTDIVVDRKLVDDDIMNVSLLHRKREVGTAATRDVGKMVYDTMDGQRPRLRELVHSNTYQLGCVLADRNNARRSLGFISMLDLRSGVVGTPSESKDAANVTSQAASMVIDEPVNKSVEVETTVEEQEAAFPGVVVAEKVMENSPNDALWSEIIKDVGDRTDNNRTSVALPTVSTCETSLLHAVSAGEVTVATHRSPPRNSICDAPAAQSAAQTPDVSVTLTTEVSTVVKGPRSALECLSAPHRSASAIQRSQSHTDSMLPSPSIGDTSALLNALDSPTLLTSSLVKLSQLDSETATPTTGEKRKATNRARYGDTAKRIRLESVTVEQPVHGSQDHTADDPILPADSVVIDGDAAPLSDSVLLHAPITPSEAMPATMHSSGKKNSTRSRASTAKGEGFVESSCRKVWAIMAVANNWPPDIAENKYAELKPVEKSEITMFYTGCKRTLGSKDEVATQELVLDAVTRILSDASKQSGRQTRGQSSAPANDPVK